MKIEDPKGGSAEVKPNQWMKFDIELDESDLQAIAIKNKLMLDSLTVGQKYQVLVKQAEVLVALQFEAEGLHGKKSVTELADDFNKYVASLPSFEG